MKPATLRDKFAAAFQDSDTQVQQLLQELRTLASQLPVSDSHHLETLYGIGHSSLKAGQAETARAAFITLVAQSPLEARFHAGLSLAQKGVDDLDAAYVSMVLAHHLDPANPGYIVASAEMLMAMQQWPLARLALMGVVAQCQHEAEHQTVRRRAEALLELCPHGA